MKIRTILVLGSVATLLGMCVYAYFNEWIIIRKPWELSHSSKILLSTKKRSHIKLLFWHKDKWKVDTISVIAPAHVQEFWSVLLKAWFHEANQIGLIKNTISVEAVLCDQRSAVLYISLNAIPFDHNQSTQKILCVLEALLKTIKINDPGNVKSIQLLVHHKIVDMPYIDCNKPLPITGFGITPI